jgi:hypothetical protein
MGFFAENIMKKLKFKFENGNYSIYEDGKIMGYISYWDEFKEWRLTQGDAEDATLNVVRILEVAQFILTLKK